MNIETTLEQPLVEGPTVVASLYSPATFVAFLPTTAMPYSIRLRLPAPTSDAEVSGIARLLLEIKTFAVDALNGTMHAWHEGRGTDGADPDRSVHVVLTFEDSVNQLEVTHALNRLYDGDEALVLGRSDEE